MSKRILIGAAGAIVVAAAVAAALFLSRLDRLVANAVETHGAVATGTEVSVGSVDVELRAGRAGISELTIDNPPGFMTDFAVRIGNVDATLDLRSLTGKVPVVSELRLNDALIHAEQVGGATNLTEIQSYASAPRGNSLADDEPARRIIIDRFRLTNARVRISSDLSNEQEELLLGDVVVEDIGRDSGGATFGEAAAAILNPILAAARTAARQRLGSEAGEALRDELRERVEDEAGGSLRELLDRE